MEKTKNALSSDLDPIVSRTTVPKKAVAVVGASVAVVVNVDVVVDDEVVVVVVN